MAKHWRTLALACALGGTLSACAPAADEEAGGGGGGPQPVQNDRLPDSNNVNPSPVPDSYIDEEAERRHAR